MLTYPLWYSYLMSQLIEEANDYQVTWLPPMFENQTVSVSFGCVYQKK